MTAPASATRLSEKNFSAGPDTVNSSAAVSSALPTSRLAWRKERSSIGPLGGTPTCHRPMRPGSSCRLDWAPGAITSITSGMKENSRRAVVATSPLARSSDAAIALRYSRLVSMPESDVADRADCSAAIAAGRSPAVTITLASMGS